MQFITIGVYGYSEKEFFEALIYNQIDLFIDIRQRRGVRGKQYSFVNSNYLQNKLKEFGISYIHEKALAPTTEIRNAQKLVDKQNKELKVNRSELGSIFQEKYTNEIIGQFDFSAFINELDNKYKKIVLFCVESVPTACHRGIVANHLEKMNYKVNHITK